MIKKIIAIALGICLVGGTFATAYADEVQTADVTQTQNEVTTDEVQTQNEVTTVEVQNEVTADEKVISETAGILPDSPLYSLEVKIEQLQIAITQSQEKLASMKAEFAVERAAEAIVMTNEEEDELAEKATNEYLKMLASSAAHINKAIQAKEDAVETMDALNDSYKNSEQILSALLSKVPDEAKAAIENALNEQDKTIAAINSFYAAKKAFFEAKDQLKEAKQELKLAREGGSPEAIQIAEEKVKETEALKDELEELKDAAELAKEEVKNLTEQAEKSIESGFKNIEKANEKMDKLEEKASQKAQKLEEKQIKENLKQIEKDKKEEEKLSKEIKKAEEKARVEAQKLEEKAKEEEKKAEEHNKE